jgi:hypothetical protein
MCSSLPAVRHRKVMLKLWVLGLATASLDREAEGQLVVEMFVSAEGVAARRLGLVLHAFVFALEAVDVLEALVLVRVDKGLGYGLSAGVTVVPRTARRVA